MNPSPGIDPSRRPSPRYAHLFSSCTCQEAQNLASEDPLAPEFLEAVQEAVIAGVQASLGYVARDGSSSNRNVHPLGVAAQGAIWYLVADTIDGLRTFRLDRMRTFEPIGRPVIRPPGFVLSEAWDLITESVNEKRLPMTARCLVNPDRIHLLRLRLGTRLRIGGPAIQIAGADWKSVRVEVEVRGFNEYVLAGDLAGFGSILEVLESPELRARLAEIARELHNFYQ
jgi:predicted DNA-binding transcriptional regulator YafY